MLNVYPVYGAGTNPDRQMVIASLPVEGDGAEGGRSCPGERDLGVARSRLLDEAYCRSAGCGGDPARAIAVPAVAAFEPKYLPPQCVRNARRGISLGQADRPGIVCGDGSDPRTLGCLKHRLLRLQVLEHKRRAARRYRLFYRLRPFFATVVSGFPCLEVPSSRGSSNDRRYRPSGPSRSP
jgi:hypothetical protein